MQTEELRLNLGAGPQPLAGYVNVDRKDGGEVYPLKVPQRGGLAKPGATVDDANGLRWSPADGTVDVVRASHCLEHFGHRETLNVLKEWVRVLKPGGVLKVAVPDWDFIVSEAARGNPNRLPLEGYVMGGHVDGDDHHGALFTKQKLAHLMTLAGLTDLKPWVSEIKDCASLPVSLNLMGTKPGADMPAPVVADEDETFSVRFNGDDFDAFKRNVYSQNGEDGILEEIFKRIGTTNKHCFEVGAGDGILFSNTRRLIEEGWTSHQIEGDGAKWCRLLELYGASKGVRPIYATVDADDNSLDKVLGFYTCPDVPDLGVIDIDGQDYYVWNAMLRVRPRVMVVEFNPDADPAYIPPRGYAGPELLQAGHTAIALVGAAKGYICIAKTACNLIFVEKESASDLIDDELLARIRQDKPPTTPQMPKPPLPATNAEAEQRRGKSEPLPAKVAAVLSIPRLCFSESMFRTLEAFRKLRIGVTKSTGVFWSQCLSRLMEPHLEDGTEFILTVDYDTVFEADDVRELVRLMLANPHADAVFATQVGRDRDAVLLTIKGADGKNQGQVRREAVTDADLLPVSTGHFGLTLIRTASLAKLPRPWFHAQPGEDGRWGEGRVDDDISFWRGWEKAGLTLYQANRVRVGHLQQVVTWPTPELKAVHQYVPEYTSGGKPPI